MPIYNHDHTAYFKQMYEWHMKMHHYHEQLRVYHLDRAKHFQKLLDEYGRPKEDNGVA